MFWEKTGCEGFTLGHEARLKVNLWGGWILTWTMNHDPLIVLHSGLDIIDLPIVVTKATCFTRCFGFKIFKIIVSLHGMAEMFRRFPWQVRSDFYASQGNFAYLTRDWVLFTSWTIENSEFPYPPRTSHRHETNTSAFLFRCRCHRICGLSGLIIHLAHWCNISQPQRVFREDLPQGLSLQRSANLQWPRLQCSRSFQRQLMQIAQVNRQDRGCQQPPTARCVGGLDRSIKKYLRLMHI